MIPFKITFIYLFFLTLALAKVNKLTCHFELFMEPTGYACYSINADISDENAPVALEGTHEKGSKKGNEHVAFISIWSTVNHYVVPSIFKLFPSLRVYQSMTNVKSISNNSFVDAKHLQELKLKAGSISVLNAFCFQEVKTLITLDLQSNEIKEIHEKAFAELKSLKLLSMHKNNINVLHPKVFDDLVSLQKLKLNGNKIKVLDKRLFLKNLQLQEISFNNNHIAILMPEMFLTLKKLNLLEFMDNECFNQSFSGKTIEELGNYVQNCTEENTMEHKYNKLTKMKAACDRNLKDCERFSIAERKQIKDNENKLKSDLKEMKLNEDACQKTNTHLKNENDLQLKNCESSKLLEIGNLNTTCERRISDFIANATKAYKNCKEDLELIKPYNESSADHKSLQKCEQNIMEFEKAIDKLNNTRNFTYNMDCLSQKKLSEMSFTKNLADLRRELSILSSINHNLNFVFENCENQKYEKELNLGESLDVGEELMKKKDLLASQVSAHKSNKNSEFLSDDISSNFSSESIVQNQKNILGKCLADLEYCNQFRESLAAYILDLTEDFADQRYACRQFLFKGNRDESKNQLCSIIEKGMTHCNLQIYEAMHVLRNSANFYDLSWKKLQEVKKACHGFNKIFHELDCWRTNNQFSSEYLNYDL